MRDQERVAEGNGNPLDVARTTAWQIAPHRVGAPVDVDREKRPSQLARLSRGEEPVFADLDSRDRGPFPLETLVARYVIAHEDRLPPAVAAGD